ncbi:MAG: hypothetical protein AAFP19_05355 [Bacteroidota bacterium]
MLHLMINDFKLIFRDASLRTFLVVPLIVFLIVLVALPRLLASYAVVADFVPVVLMGALMQCSTMFGFIYSMVFIEEKELEVVSVYGVAPIAKWPFVASRLIAPTLFSLLFTFLLVAMQPFYEIHWLSNLALSLSAALLMPIMAILTAGVSKNKIEGMTWYKIFNLLVNLPLLAYFVPEVYAHLFGILPTHWTFWSLHEGIEGSFLPWTIAIAFIYLIAMVTGLTWRFSKRHYT